MRYKAPTKSAIATLMTIAAFGFSSAGYAEKMEKSALMDHMKHTLPEHFCKGGSYFTECFSVDNNQCQQAIKSAYNGCVEKHGSAIPASLSQGEVADWGNKIGSCAGSKYESDLAAKRISNARCNNIDNWVPKK